MLRQLVFEPKRPATSCGKFTQSFRNKFTSKWSTMHYDDWRSCYLGSCRLIWVERHGYRFNALSGRSVLTAGRCRMAQILIPPYRGHGCTHNTSHKHFESVFIPFSNILFCNESVHAISSALDDICGYAEASVYQLSGNLFMAKKRNEFCDKIKIGHWQ